MTGSATVQASAPSLCVEGVAGSRAIVAVPVAIIVAVGTVWMTLLWAEAAGLAWRDHVGSLWGG